MSLHDDADLALLLRQHVGATDPGPMSIGPALERGRRRLRRRRAARGITAVAAVAVVGGTVTTGLVGGRGPDGPTTVIDPSSAAALRDYDPAAMPALMDRRARLVLERSVSDLGRPTFRAEAAGAEPQVADLPRSQWSRATSLHLTYGPAAHRYAVTISHSRSEAEGVPTEFCADNVADGIALSCTARRTDVGDVVVTEVTAVRPFDQMSEGLAWDGTWIVVPRAELAAIPLRKLWFQQQAKVIKSGTLVTYATETTKAQRRTPSFTTPIDDLVEIGADPLLVMPRPGD